VKKITFSSAALHSYKINILIIENVSTRKFSFQLAVLERREMKKGAIFLESVVVKL
jgi:hypothetical protein